MSPVKKPAVLATAICLMLFASSKPQAEPVAIDPSEQAFALDTSMMAGFEILTAEDGAMGARNMVVVKYDGPITSPMATNLRAIWDQIRMHPRFEKFVLRLNSPGGVDTHGMEVLEVLKDIRQQASLITLVGEHDLCASMCVAIYIQGQTRYASPASTWMFHGASASQGGVPSLTMTMRYFDLFKDRDIDKRFIDFLFENQYVTAPGAYWLSGSELAGQSNIITKLLPNWKPATAEPPPVARILGRI